MYFDISFLDGKLGCLWHLKKTIPVNFLALPFHQSPNQHLIFRRRAFRHVTVDLIHKIEFLIGRKCQNVQLFTVLLNFRVCFLFQRNGWILFIFSIDCFQYEENKMTESLEFCSVSENR